MADPYYVALTGSKNNAGDYLIKHRAFDLLSKFRPDRHLVEFNEWEALDDKKLAIVNESEALILVGGPGVVRTMYPNTYPLRSNLDDITVPIILLGVGWKDVQGDWRNTHSYRLSDDSLQLLRKINDSGCQSSVRDYHTRNVLALRGFSNVLMTGCPAYYDLNYVGKDNDPAPETSIERVAFSLGVTFVSSPSMNEATRQTILSLRDYFGSAGFEVVFHHAMDGQKFQQVYGAQYQRHADKHLQMADWLNANGINTVDISGSADKLMNYYESVDLHIGFRVHAHIHMHSISRPSVLISEDGRGRATERVIGGVVVNSVEEYRYDLVSRVLNKLLPGFDPIRVNPHLAAEVIQAMDYEKKTRFSRMRLSRFAIDKNFEVMKTFFEQLP